MAPRARRGEETEAEDAAQESTIALVLPPTTVLKDLARLKKSTSARSSVITDEYSKAVQKAVEKKHVDRKANSIAQSLAAMDDGKLAITLPHLLHYIEALGLEERASKQAEMFGNGVTEGEEEAEGEEDETDTKKKRKKRNGGRRQAAAEASNVTPIGSAARDVVEEAGKDFH